MTTSEQKMEKGRRLKGLVVSDKMTKTVIVKVVRMRKHPKYRKFQKISKKFKAHDENGEFHIGDTVIIHESRPISKDKRWIVVRHLSERSEAKRTRAQE